MQVRRGITIGCLALAFALGWGAPGAQSAARQQPAGATVETAIVLPHIADEFHGVAAEQAYLAAHFPTWHIEYQASIEQNGRRYDLLGMIEPDGTKTVLYFDITPWFGK
jgi:hypothetical protein